MALITCPECGAEVSDRVNTCFKCGCPLAKQPVRIKFEISSGIFGVKQAFNNHCYAKILGDSQELSCRQGEVITLDLDAPTIVVIRMQCVWGKIEQTLVPGASYVVSSSPSGKIQIRKVDMFI